MIGRLKILTKVIQRRVQAGETQDDVLKDYLLTDDEKAEVVAALKMDTATTNATT